MHPPAAEHPRTEEASPDTPSARGARLERHLPRPTQRTLDRAGALASATCAVHCAASALLPALLSGLGLGLLLSDELEWLLATLAMTMAVGAAFIGLRVHRSWRIAGALFGLAAILLLGRFLAPHHRLAEGLAIAAGLGLFASHMASHRASQRASRGADRCPSEEAGHADRHRR